MVRDQFVVESVKAPSLVDDRPMVNDARNDVDEERRQSSWNEIKQFIAGCINKRDFKELKAVANPAKTADIVTGIFLDLIYNQKQYIWLEMKKLMNDLDVSKLS